MFSRSLCLLYFSDLRDRHTRTGLFFHDEYHLSKLSTVFLWSQDLDCHCFLERVVGRGSLWKSFKQFTKHRISNRRTVKLN